MAFFTATASGLRAPSKPTRPERQALAVTRKRRIISGWLLSILLLCAGATGAQAQNQLPSQTPPPGTGQAQPRLEPTGESFGNWRLICAVPTDPAAQGQPQTCFISQRFLDPNSQRPILIVTIGRFRPGAPLAALFALPLGVPLSKGIEINVDGRPVMTVPFDICRRDGCQVFVQMNDTLVGAFKAGNQASAIVRSSAGEGLNLPFSLQGFTAGYERVN